MAPMRIVATAACIAKSGQIADRFLADFVRVKMRPYLKELGL